MSAALTHASAIVLLCQAQTLTYKITRVPNFNIGTTALLGCYTAYISTVLLDQNPQLAYPAAIVVCTTFSILFGALFYELQFKKKRTQIYLTIITLATMMIIENVGHIFSYWIRETHSRYNQSFMLLEYDFRIGELSGTYLVANALAIISVVTLWRLNKKTRFGVTSTAILENSTLAQIQGVNPFPIYVWTWGLSGVFAGLAGVILSMRFHITSYTGSWIVWSVFAGVLLGGIDSLFGSAFGGFFVGILDILLVSWSQAIIGVWVGEFRQFFAFWTIILVMCLRPNGLLGNYLDQPGSRNHKWRLE